MMFRKVTSCSILHTTATVKFPSEQGSYHYPALLAHVHKHKDDYLRLLEF